MDAILISRLQFAMTTMFHFLFVPLTMGLAILIAIMETKYVRTGDEDYKRLAKFWGKIFLINFAVGVVTGITLEFQFGTNWSRYSEYVGDIFGSLLAIEATSSFFLESTFIGIWHFGWNRLSPKMHAASIWLVAIASSLSAVWILIANAWMQHPVGFVIRNGRAELEDFLAIVTQEFAWLEITHTVMATFILSGFFVMGVSAYQILRKHEAKMFKKSFVIAATFALVFSVLEVVEGHIHGADLAEAQPAKLAAMESHWETQERAAIPLLTIPDVDNERNAVEFLPVPGLLSYLAKHDFNAEVTGLKDFPPEDRPPVLIPFISFRFMVALAFLFVLLSGWAWLRRNKIEKYPLLMKLLLLAIPLPYIACQLGWMLAEVGRQPWIVYGIMRTVDAASPVSAPQVLTSFISFTAVYTLLGIFAFFLIVKTVKAGVGQADEPAVKGEN